MFPKKKLLLGFAIGAIPIYYGTKEVFKLFNKDAFIYYDVASPQRALDTILYLEQNTTAYLEMRGKPILAPNAEKFLLLLYQRPKRPWLPYQAAAKRLGKLMQKVMLRDM